MTIDPIELIQKEFDETVAKINVLKAQLKETSKILMKDMFSAFFNKYNDVASNIFWMQYTPYFNDGEACEFNVHDVYLNLRNKNADDEDDDDDEEYEKYDEGSTLYDKSHLNNLYADLKQMVAWEKDPMVEAKNYQSDYIKKYNRDPFSNTEYYNRGKTEDQLMKAWKPTYYKNSQEILDKIQMVNEFLKKYPTLKRDFDKVRTMISSIDEDLMEAMFGDHVKVIVTKNGIETEEYSHD